MGFGWKWISWIIKCVGSASMSKTILLNGSPLKPFKMEKGLRQSDPLSPYLFILISEALVCLLRKAVEMNLIEAVQIGKDKVRLKHLQLADDSLIFALKITTTVTNYFRIQDVFTAMSGLRLNYSKSKIISQSSDDQEWTSRLTSQNGCLHANCPVNYLGLPLGENMNK